jgi:hypothetical protein
VAPSLGTNPSSHLLLPFSLPLGASAETYELTVDAASNGTSTVVNIKDSSGSVRVVKIKDIDYTLGAPLFRATMDGSPRTVQCLGSSTLGYVRRTDDSI